MNRNAQVWQAEGDQLAHMAPHIISTGIRAAAEAVAEHIKTNRRAYNHRRGSVAVRVYEMDWATVTFYDGNGVRRVFDVTPRRTEIAA